MRDFLTGEARDVLHACIGALAVTLGLAIAQYIGAHILPFIHAAGELAGSFIAVKIGK